NDFFITVEGNKKGYWINSFNQQEGDLIDLWRIKRKTSVAEATFSAKQWLGIGDANLIAPATKNTAIFNLNDYARLQECSSLVEDLKKNHKISFDTLNQFKLHQQSDWLVFPYFKKDFVKQIKIAYFFDLIIPIKEEYQSKNQTTLFGWQALSDDARTVALTLNEIDAMSLHQYGIPSLAIPLTENLRQALTWLPQEYDDLSIFDKIYFCWHENNKTQALTNALRERLGRHRCYQVQLPHESANACLRNGIEQANIQKCFTHAKTSDPNELKPAMDYTDDVIRLVTQDRQHVNAYETPWQKCRGRIHFRPNELSVWTGINGHGKSQLLGYLMLHFMQQGAKVCVASLELKPERVLLRLDRQLHATNTLNTENIRSAQNWYHDRLWLFDLVGATKIQRLLFVFEYARQRYGIDVFLIDSMMKCGIAEDDYNTQKQFTEQLCDFKNSHPCHIHLVTHPRKSQDENYLPNKMDIKGTGSITDLADNVFTVWRNKNKSLGEPDAILQCDKQRNGEWEGKISLWFDSVSLHYLETVQSISTPLFENSKNIDDLGDDTIPAIKSSLHSSNEAIAA
ncbi:MAG: hypothetical protein A3F10_06925, partial [Coxiella sp. RIFCSPHIGHO2_12_FULL_42_15]